MRRVFAFFAVACFVLAILLGGWAPFGRAALALGAPRLAASLFEDPAWQGVAYFRAADYDAAALAMQDAGADGLFNLGNAQAHRGAYAAALEAFDLSLARGVDLQARANFDLLRAYYAGTGIETDGFFLIEKREGDTAPAPIARGNARGAGSGDEVTNTGSTLGLAELTTEGREQRVRHVFDDRFVVANDRWLATLEDVPGAFLNERIKHEFRRRRDSGIGQAPQDTPW